MEDIEAGICGGPDDATSLVELTQLLVARARRCRSQLRALEAETGISKTTWSAWSRGQRAAGRDRVALVAGRYDAGRTGDWLAAWDRLATAPSPSAAPAAAAVPGPRRPVVPAPAAVGVLVLGLVGLGATVGSAPSRAPVPRPVDRVSAVAGTAPRTGRDDVTTLLAPAAPPEAPVRLLSPAAGAVVPGCLVVEGAGRPDPGQVLVVSVRGWAARAASFRFAPVRYAASDRPADWTARQPLPDAAADYEVLVVAVDARAAQVEHDLNVASGGGWVAAQLPIGARVVSAVRVRAAGPPARACPS